MNQFTADIAAALELALIGSGFVVLYFALKEQSKLLKLAAAVMVIGGILGLSCTSYWWFKYNSMGVFDNPAVSTVNVMHHDGDAMHHILPKD